MSWALEVSPQFERDYLKLCGKNAALRRAVDKKVAQILEHPLHYKPLRGVLKGVRRVHVQTHFVLLFEPNARKKLVRLLRLAHHDEAY